MLHLEATKNLLSLFSTLWSLKDHGFERYFLVEMHLLDSYWKMVKKCRSRYFESRRRQLGSQLHDTNDHCRCPMHSNFGGTDVVNLLPISLEVATTRMLVCVRINGRPVFLPALGLFLDCKLYFTVIGVSFF